MITLFALWSCVLLRPHTVSEETAYGILLRARLKRGQFSGPSIFLNDCPHLRVDHVCLDCFMNYSTRGRASPSTDTTGPRGVRRERELPQRKQGDRLPFPKISMNGQPASPVNGRTTRLP